MRTFADPSIGSLNRHKIYWKQWSCSIYWRLLSTSIWTFYRVELSRRFLNLPRHFWPRRWSCQIGSIWRVSSSNLFCLRLCTRLIGSLHRWCCRWNGISVLVIYCRVRMRIMGRLFCFGRRLCPSRFWLISGWKGPLCRRLVNSRCLFVCRPAANWCIFSALGRKRSPWCSGLRPSPCRIWCGLEVEGGWCWTRRWNRISVYRRGSWCILGKGPKVECCRYQE